MGLRSEFQNCLDIGYANNGAEVLHEPTRQRERAMRGFTSPKQGQRISHSMD